jgi:hypothetical protein
VSQIPLFNTLVLRPAMRKLLFVSRITVLTLLSLLRRRAALFAGLLIIRLLLLMLGIPLPFPIVL